MGEAKRRKKLDPNWGKYQARQKHQRFLRNPEDPNAFKLKTPLIIPPSNNRDPNFTDKLVIPPEIFVCAMEGFDCFGRGFVQVELSGVLNYVSYEYIKNSVTQTQEFINMLASYDPENEIILDLPEPDGYHSFVFKNRIPVAIKEAVLLAAKAGVPLSIGSI